MCPHNLQEPPASWQPEEEAGSLSQALNPTQTYMYLLGQDTLAAKAEEDQKAPENPDEAGLDTIIKEAPIPHLCRTGVRGSGARRRSTGGRVAT